MKSFILFVAVVFAGGTLLFQYAGELSAHGFRWVSDACSAARVFCDNPQLAASVALGLTGIWAVLKTASIMRE